MEAHAAGEDAGGAERAQAGADRGVALHEAVEGADGGEGGACVQRVLARQLPGLRGQQALQLGEGDH